MINNRRELDLLKKIKHELKASLEENTWIPPEKLKTLRNHIKLCDQIEKGKFDTCIFFTTVDYWKRCYVRWLMHRRAEEEDVEISDLYVKTKRTPSQETKLQSTSLAKLDHSPKDPKKPWEITINDEPFLRKLKIAKGNKLVDPNKNQDPDPV